MQKCKNLFIIKLFNYYKLIIFLDIYALKHLPNGKSVEALTLELIRGHPNLGLASVI